MGARSSRSYTGSCAPRLILALILLRGVQLFLLELHDPYLQSLVLTPGSLKPFSKLAELRTCALRTLSLCAQLEVHVFLLESLIPLLQGFVLTRGML